MGQLDKANSTEVNRPQPSAVTPQKPRMVDWALVSKCEDELQAVVLCVHMSGLKHEWIRDQLGIDKGHWTRLMQGNGNFPTQKRTQLMSICGNVAPLQWENMRLGYQMFENQIDREERELREKLAAIEAQREMMHSGFLKAA